MVATKSLGAIAALSLANVAQAWYNELPSCLAPFDPFVYSGCYSNVRANGDEGLDVHSDFNRDNQTIQSCVAHCKGNAYRVAGLSYYGVCSCGQTVSTALVADSQCNTPCSGNSSQTCGGDRALSVYLDPTFPPIEDQNTIAEYVSVGCWTDESATGRALAFPMSLQTTTTESCLQACLNIGYPFAGTEFSTECYCGIVIGNGTAATNQSECNLPCGGNLNEICGGSRRLSLYVAKDLQSLEPCGAAGGGQPGTDPGTGTTTTSGTSTTTVSTSSTTTSLFTVPTTTTIPPLPITTTSSSSSSSSSTTSSSTTTTTTTSSSTTTSSTTTATSSSSSSSISSSSTGAPSSSSSSTGAPSSSSSSAGGPSSSSSSISSSSTGGPSSSNTFTGGPSSPSATATSTDGSTGTTIADPNATTTTSTTSGSSTITGGSATGTSVPVGPGGPLCKAAKVIEPTCEYEIGDWCSNPLPDWDNKKSCLTSWSQCVFQSSSCFLKAGYPESLQCFEYAEWCSKLDVYCLTKCDGVPECDGKSAFFKTSPPKGNNAAVTTTSTFPCPTTIPTTITTTTSTTAAATSTSCPVPTPTGICIQPENKRWGYGPGKPVGGIELPIVTCNNIRDDYRAGNIFKLYTDNDSRRSPSFPRPRFPDACSQACRVQFNQCQSVYGEGIRHGRFGPGGRNFRDANSACRAQFSDCLAINRNVRDNHHCEHWEDVC